MATDKPLLKTYIEKDYKAKFKYISDKDHRSDSNLLEMIIINYVDNYEKENGRLTVEENGSITVSKPFKVESPTLRITNFKKWIEEHKGF